MTDPQKGYHLELATTHLRVSRELDTLLLELGYAPKETTRKANYITYFKQSEAIEDLLTAIGAPVSAMELMNAKAEKLLRNGVNRRVNCEAANVDKTVDAALEQRRAIQILRDRGPWRPSLPSSGRPPSFEKPTLSSPWPSWPLCASPL